MEFIVNILSPSSSGNSRKIPKNVSTVEDALGLIERETPEDDSNDSENNLEFKIDIEEKFDDLNSAHLTKLTKIFKTRSVVIFLAAKDDSKFVIFWKSCDNEQFLMLKQFRAKFSVDDKEVWRLTANFIINSLRNGRFGIQDGLNIEAKNYQIELHELADHRGYNLLLLACESGNAQPISTLVKLGFLTKLPGNDQVTAQILAQQGKHSNVLLKLLQANLPFPPNLDVNDCSEELKKFIEMSTEFHEMIKAKNTNKLAEIIQQNPNLRYFYNLSNDSALKTALCLKYFITYEHLISNSLTFAPHEDPKDFWGDFEPKEKRLLRNIHLKYKKHLTSKHINILMANTFLTHDETDEEGKRELALRAYQKLNEHPLLEIILKAVAAVKDFSIIFDFFRDSTSRIDPDGNEFTEATFYFNGRIIIGAKQLLDPSTENYVYGCLIHELFHFANFAAFENNADPHKSNDLQTKEEYARILDICRQNKDEEWIISSVYDDYPEDEQPSELIVRPAQLIAMYRHDAEILQGIIAAFPELFTFFENVVIPALRAAIPDIEARLVYKSTQTFGKLSEQNKEEVKNADVMYKNVEVKLSQLINEKSEVYEKLLPDHIAQLLEGNILNFDDPHLHYLDELLIFGWEKLAKNLKNKLLISNLNYQGEVTNFMRLNATNPDSFAFLTSRQIREILSETQIIVGRKFEGEVPFYIDRKYIPEDAKWVNFEYMYGYEYREISPFHREMHIGQRTFNQTFEEFYNIFQLQEFHLRDKIFEKVKENSHYKIFCFKLNAEVFHFSHKNSDEIIERAFKKRIFILSSEAGAGKTVSFENFAVEIKRKFPTFWVSYIDLKDYTKFYKKSRNIEELLTEILNLNSKNTFEMKIFQESFKNGKVVLLWNGFDEISPTYNEYILETMKSICKNTKNIQFICTRPLYAEQLRNAFKTRTYLLVPFDENVKREFLTKTFSTQNVSSENIHKSVQKVEEILKNLESFKDVIYDFNTPLILKLFAEVNEGEVLLNLSNLYQIFDMFVDKKIEIWLNRSENSISKAKMLRLGQNLEEIYQKFALLSSLKFVAHTSLGFKIMKLKIMQTKIPKELPYEEISRMGILYLNGENKFEFAHLTFSEFFVAKYFIEKIYESVDEELSDNEAELRLEIFYMFIKIYGTDQKIISDFILSYIKMENKKECKSFNPKILKLLSTKFNNFFFRMLDKKKALVFEFLFKFFKKDHKLLVNLLRVNEDETLYTAIFNPNHFAHAMKPEEIKTMIKDYLTDEEFQKFVSGKNQKGKFLFGFFFYGLLGAPKINYDYISDIKALKITSFWEFPIKIKAVLTINEQKELFKMLMSPKIFLFYDKMFRIFSLDGYENIWKSYENLLTTSEMQEEIGNAFIQFFEILPHSKLANKTIFSILLKKAEFFLSSPQIHEMIKTKNILHEAHWEAVHCFKPLWNFLKKHTSLKDQRKILLQSGRNNKNFEFHFMFNDPKTLFTYFDQYPYYFYDFSPFTILHRSMIAMFGFNLDFTLKIYREHFSEKQIQNIILGGSNDFILYSLRRHGVPEIERMILKKLTSHLRQLFKRREKSLKEFLERKVEDTNLTPFQLVESFKEVPHAIPEWFEYIKYFEDLYNSVKNY